MLWARVWVDELGRLDLPGVVISPGSRSTPLAMAFADQERLPIYVMHDERSAAYFALGLGLASGRPGVLLCTSGTAAANYLPAIVEANQAGVPLLALTADRPGELRDSGANQTIDQLKLFGDQVRWFVDVGQPEAEPAGVRIRALRTLADRAVAQTLDPLPGPVHVNFPFAKPLEPTRVLADLPDAYWEQNRDWIDGRPNGRPWVETTTGGRELGRDQLEALARQINQAARGVIVCGPRRTGEEFGDAAIAFGKQSGFPILADPLSGVRYGPLSDWAGVLGQYETFLGAPTNLDRPDLIVQFGGEPVSRNLLNYLARLDGVPRILISPAGAWADEDQSISMLVRAEPENLCQQLLAGVQAGDNARAGWREAWVELEILARGLNRKVMQAARFEGSRALELFEQLATGATIFVGNSLPIRHVDEFVAPASKDWQVYGNRGASGIDGTVATALGVAAGRGNPGVVVFLGDVALLHDLTALMYIQAFGLEVKVVVLNNDGGGIFERLPIAAYEMQFRKMFTTPHGLNFRAAAEQFGVPYRFISEADPLAGVLDAPGGMLIEVQGDARRHEEMRRGIHTDLLALLDSSAGELKVNHTSDRRSEGNE